MNTTNNTDINTISFQKRFSGVIALAATGVLILAVQVSVSTADQVTAPAIQESEGLKLPADLQGNQEAVDETNTGLGKGAVPKFEIEEKRVGGRLERVTVKRANGIDEVYENKEIDSMFSKEADELGEVPNVRRWTIGTF